MLGFGGAEIGFNPLEVSTVKQIIKEALDEGITLFDTAAAYLSSEQLLGECLKGRRKNVTLVTKCGAIDGFKRSDWSKEGILRTIQQSLSNLQTDHIDVVLLHSCGALEFLWGEAAEALIEAKKRGYTKWIGYSGDGSSALAAIRSGHFDVLETSLNIADQEPITLTLPEAKAANMGVIIKRPLANTAWRKADLEKTDYNYDYWKRLQKLEYEFLGTGLADEIDAALRFTLSQPGVSVAIVGASKVGRVHENAKLIQAGPLPQSAIKAIRDRWKEVADATWVGQI